MKKDNKVYLKHILDAINKIEKFLGDVDYNKMSNDELLTSSLAYQLIVVGEAANNLSQKFKERYSEITWREIISMRNIIIHKYFGVKRKLIWDTCKDDLPEFKKFIEKVLRGNELR